MKNSILFMFILTVFIVNENAIAQSIVKNDFKKVYTFTKNMGQVPNLIFKENEEILYSYKKDNGYIYFLKNKIKEVTFLKKDINTEKNKIDNNIVIQEFTFIDANISSKYEVSKKNSYYENFYLNGSDQGIVNVPTFDNLTLKNIYNGVDINFTVLNNEFQARIVAHNSNKNDILINKNVIYDNYQKTEIIEQKLTSGNKNDSLIITVLENEFLFDLSNEIDDNTIGLKTDNSNNIFIYGNTMSLSAIGTSGVHQENNYSDGFFDAFICCYDSLLNKKWGTYFGGVWTDFVSKMEILNHSLILVGKTESPIGISTSDAVNVNYNQDILWNGFIGKFDFNGHRLYSTYLSEGTIENMHIDTDKNIYLSGGAEYRYLSKHDSLGNLIWKKVYELHGYSTIVNSFYSENDTLYIIGTTRLTDSISTPNSYMPNKPSSSNLNSTFISCFDSLGNVVWSTYFGGTGNSMGRYIGKINDDLIVLGHHGSDPFNSQFSQNHGGLDIYITKFSKNGIPIIGKYLGGIGGDAINEVITKNNSIFIFGNTTSPDSIATLYAYQPNYSSIYKGYILSVSNDLDVRWGTYSREFIDYEIANNNKIICLGKIDYDSLFIHIFKEDDITQIPNILYSSNSIVYPNPFTDKLFVNNPSHENTAVKLYNSHGQLLQTENMKEAQLIINTEKYPKGMYLLQLSNNKGEKTVKVVKE